MKANQLYKRINNDFEIDKYKDDWGFVEFNEYIDPGFKERYIGAMLDMLRTSSATI